LRRVLLAAAAGLALVIVVALRRTSEPGSTMVALEGPESAVLPRRTYAKSDLAVTRETLVVGGERRTFLLLAPNDSGRAFPLVLVLHGDGGSSDSFHQGFPFEQASGANAILVYPDAPRGWDLETIGGNTDIAFVEAIVGTLSERFVVDRRRVFAAGYSRGGFFANMMACERSGLFRAISSSAGGAPYNRSERHPNGFPKCPGQTPTPTIALHGFRDLSVTLDSGRFTAEYWGYVNGCRPTEREPTGYSECIAWRGCAPGAAVVFCEIGNLGHWVWDRAAEASWTFFLTQSASAAPVLHGDR
jgi:polyhydroxybutyrate depolymerase